MIKFTEHPFIDPSLLWHGLSARVSGAEARSIRPSKISARAKSPCHIKGYWYSMEGVIR